MEMELIVTENRENEKKFLSGYFLDTRLFDKFGLKIKDIIPFRHYYRITADKGFFCLKKLRYTMEEMAFVKEVINYLKSAGFRNIFDYIPAAENGSPFVEYEGDIYYLTECIDGRECDHLNPVDVMGAAEMLAEIHKAASGFPIDRIPKNRDFLGKWPEYMKEKALNIENSSETLYIENADREITDIYYAYRDMCIEDAKEAISILKHSGYNKLVEETRNNKGFIHHDYANHSILFNFSGEPYIADFEYCACDIKVHDLGSFLYRNLKRSNWNMDTALYIIDSYNSRLTIKNEELKVLQAFLTFPQDFESVAKQCFAAKKAWDDDSCIEKMCINSEYNMNRRRFLQEFSKRL